MREVGFPPTRPKPIAKLLRRLRALHRRLAGMRVRWVREVVGLLGMDEGGRIEQVILVALSLEATAQLGRQSHADG